MTNSKIKVKEELHSSMSNLFEGYNFIETMERLCNLNKQALGLEKALSNWCMADVVDLNALFFMIIGCSEMSKNNYCLASSYYTQMCKDADGYSEIDGLSVVCGIVRCMAGLGIKYDTTKCRSTETIKLLNEYGVGVPATQVLGIIYDNISFYINYAGYIALIANALYLEKQSSLAINLLYQARSMTPDNLLLNLAYSNMLVRHSVQCEEPEKTYWCMLAAVVLREYEEKYKDKNYLWVKLGLANTYCELASISLFAKKTEGAKKYIEQAKQYLQSANYPCWELDNKIALLKARYELLPEATSCDSMAEIEEPETDDGGAKNHQSLRF